MQITIKYLEEVLSADCRVGFVKKKTLKYNIQRGKLNAGEYIQNTRNSSSSQRIILINRHTTVSSQPFLYLKKQLFVTYVQIFFLKINKRPAKLNGGTKTAETQSICALSYTSVHGVLNAPKVF